MSEDNAASAPELREVVLRTLDQVPGRQGDPPDAADQLAGLGFDSLAYAELAAVLEVSSGVDLLDAGLGPVRTVGDLLDAADRASLHRGAGGEVMPIRLGSRQSLAKSSMSGLFRRWFHLKVTGMEHMPASGPVVLCMTHESSLDTPAVTVAGSRPITFMAKRELFRNPGVGWAFMRMGAFS